MKGAAQADGGVTTTVAVYAFEREMMSVGDPEKTRVGLVLYEAAEMGQVNLLGTDEITPQVVVPNGNFRCRVKVPGNVLVKGNLTSTDSCDIGGDLWAGGTVTYDGGAATIGGNVSAAGLGPSVLVAGVGDVSKELATVRTNGSLNLKWNGGRVHANVLSGGDVAVNDRRVDGSVTVPAGRSVSFGVGGSAADGVVYAPVPVVPSPDLPGWFDYSFSLADWPGYDVVTLRSSSDAARDTCNYYNAYSGWKVEPGWTNGNNRGWCDLADRSQPTIIDARACDTLTSNSGGSPSPVLKANVVFLAKQFNLTGLTLNKAAGADPSVWFITEDTALNGKPDCLVGTGSNFTINGANLAAVKSTIYSPCIVAANGGGQMRGSLYARGFASGSTLTINGELMGLPNQPTPDGSDGGGNFVPTGKQTLGAIVTQQDARSTPSP